MKKEIKFRGKLEYNGKWIYGDLLQYENGDVAIFGDKLSSFGCECTEMSKRDRVIPDTVGQYTGLKDKSGNKIFEGDIIKTPRGNIGMVIFGKAEEIVTHYVFRRKVTDVYTTYGWVFERINDGYKCAIDDSILAGNCIGNIHDNPELLKGGE